MIFKFRFLFLLTAWLMVGTATAGISYKLEQTHAVAGETVNISAVVFNDTGTLMSWKDRKSVVSGKSVSVSVDPGGRRTLKQTKHNVKKNTYSKVLTLTNKQQTIHT